MSDNFGRLKMVNFVILGEAASKANSRKIVSMNRKSKSGIVRKMPASIKSAKARNYEHSAILQIPNSAKVMFDGPVCVSIWLYYASNRPDLDESVILDILQAKFKKDGTKRILVRSGLYLNDRQVKEKHIYHRIDKENPRAEITVEEILCVEK